MTTRNCKTRVRCSSVTIPRDTPCSYCFEEWAVAWDHIVPYSRGGKTCKSNLLPVCKLCNSILSNKLFASVDDKREYAVWQRKLRSQPRESKHELRIDPIKPQKQVPSPDEMNCDRSAWVNFERNRHYIDEYSLGINEALFQVLTGH